MSVTDALTSPTAETLSSELLTAALDNTKLAGTATGAEDRASFADAALRLVQAAVTMTNSRPRRQR